MTVQAEKGFKTFLSCEDGATAIEYALIAAFIGFMLILTTPSLSSSLNTVFTSIHQKWPG